MRQAQSNLHLGRLHTLRNLDTPWQVHAPENECTEISDLQKWLKLFVILTFSMSLMKARSSMASPTSSALP